MLACIHKFGMGQHHPVQQLKRCIGEFEGEFVFRNTLVFPVGHKYDKPLPNSGCKLLEHAERIIEML
ncbi:hypothetical protein D9M69_437160 [compost metagenome]